MYLDHFGLDEYPFSLTPDTDFFFESASHREALNTLLAALRFGEGFCKVTAEIGLGKTLLCRLLLRELDDAFVTAWVPDPLLSPHALRAALAHEPDVPLGPHRGEDALLRGIQNRLISIARNGQRAVVVIDEAHQLPAETLESVRLLTNLETEKAKLLQVVIIGQPELDRRLARPQMRQLRQRVSFACNLRPLDADDIGVYVAHRLARAGAVDQDLFSNAALRRILRASRGTPRIVNMLCHKALLAAWGAGTQRIEGVHARRAIADSPSATGTVRAALGAWWPAAAARTLERAL